MNNKCTMNNKFAATEHMRDLNIVTDFSMSNKAFSNTECRTIDWCLLWSSEWAHVVHLIVLWRPRSDTWFDSDCVCPRRPVPHAYFLASRKVNVTIVCASRNLWPLVSESVNGMSQWPNNSNQAVRIKLSSLLKHPFMDILRIVFISFNMQQKASFDRTFKSKLFQTEGYSISRAI